MSRISRLDRTEVAPEIATLYDKAFSARGNVPNMFRVMAHRPEIFATMQAHFGAVLNIGTVSTKLKETVFHYQHGVNQLKTKGFQKRKTGTGDLGRVHSRPTGVLDKCSSLERSIVVRIQTEYQGDLHCTSVHTPSNTELATDAPVDNQGRGESFSPTDLVATSLGTCMLTTMGIVARTLNVDLTGATATVEKEMSSTPPRKVSRLTVAIRVPRTTSPENQQRLENAAHTCPVKKSLHPDIETPIEFVWGGG